MELKFSHTRMRSKLKSWIQISIVQRRGIHQNQAHRCNALLSLPECAVQSNNDVLRRNQPFFFLARFIVQLRDVLCYSIIVAKLQLKETSVANSGDQSSQWLVFYLKDQLCFRAITSTIDEGRLNTVSELQLDALHSILRRSCSDDIVEFWDMFEAKLL